MPSGVTSFAMFLIFTINCHGCRFNDHIVIKRHMEVTAGPFKMNQWKMCNFLYYSQFKNYSDTICNFIFFNSGCRTL